MSSSRPATPSRKRVGGESPSKKKESFEALHPSLPRPPSFPSLPTLRGSKSTGKLDKPVRQASKLSARAARPVKNLIQQSSTASSLASSTRSSAYGDPETSFDSATDDDNDIPVRRTEFNSHPSTSELGSLNNLTPLASAASLYHLHEGEDGKRENVVVCLRVRPTVKNATPIYNYKPDQDRIIFADQHPTFLKRGAMTKAHGTLNKDEYDFKFDALLLAPSPTADLYFRRIRPVVQAAMQGFNGTVFAYGQTASGKTHTMVGNDDEPGIIPLAIEEVFAFIEEDDGQTYTLRVTFLEIYNERITDLLPSEVSNEGTKMRPLDITGDDGKVSGLSAKSVTTADDVVRYLAEGDRRRRVGMTDWNERSSRSHSVFTVIIESSGPDGQGGIINRTSRLNLIDLAGSESGTGQAERQKEGAFINKSLLNLGIVIAKLTETKTGSTGAHIPYRDSKLTRLLQPALSGNSRVAIICTVSPDLEQATETLSTLKFAKRAKMIETKAERSAQISQVTMLKQYTDQIALLEGRITAGETAVAAGEMARERDSAMAHVDELVGELENQRLIAAAVLDQKENELNLLREQLNHTKSFILTAPVVAAQRRTSAQFGMGSPARNRTDAMSQLGRGTPGRAIRVFSESMGASPRVGSMEKETKLEIELEATKPQLALLKLREAELANVKEQLATHFSSTTTRLADSDRLHAERLTEMKSLKSEIEQLRIELDSSKQNHHLSEEQYRDATSELEKVQANTRTEGESARKQIDSLVSQLESAQLAVEARSEGAEERMTALREEKERANERCSTLEKQLDETIRRVRELESAVRKAAKKEVALESTLASTQQELDELKSISAQQVIKIAQLENSLAQTQEKLDLAKRRQSSTQQEHRAQVETVERERDDFREELEETTSQLEAATKAVAISRVSEGVAVARATSVEKMMEELRLECEEKISVAESTASRAEAALADRDAEIARLQRAVGVYRSNDAKTQQYAREKGTGADRLMQKINTINSGRSARLNESLGSSTTSKSRSDGNVDPLRRSSKEDMLAADDSTDSGSKSTAVAKSINSSRQTLAELNLDDDDRTGPLPAPTQGRPKPVRGRHESAPSTRSNSTYSSLQQPPPIPCSPHNQDKERRARRQTVEKDLVVLNASNSVGRSKEIFSVVSPPPSPTKLRHGSSAFESQIAAGRDSENGLGRVSSWARKTTANSIDSTGQWS